MPFKYATKIDVKIDRTPTVHDAHLFAHDSTTYGAPIVPNLARCALEKQLLDDPAFREQFRRTGGRVWIWDGSDSFMGSVQLQCVPVTRVIPVSGSMNNVAD